jgi:prepilin signal peptidase PulO-like enzyme (type II secretory pathway)
MRDRLLGLVMLLFVLAGAVGNVLYGASFPTMAQSFVGGFSGAGLFWVLTSLYFRTRKP